MKTKLNIKTKILSILLCAVMALGELPFVALAAASGTDWLLDNDGLLTIESNAGMTDWLAASPTNASPTNASQVEAVGIQNSVTIIGQRAENVDITADFTDPNFLAAVRENLGKGENDSISAGEAASVTELNVASKSIASLAGIEHFTKLKKLYCGHNALTSLPELPSTLELLHCGFNALELLPELPNTLTSLNCSYNKLTSLPELPSILRWLNCDYNDLELLPELPILIYLDCNNNELKSLPKLPSTLSTLSCSGNDLTLLPELPSKLRHLYCDFNALELLPKLPSTLKYLDCDRNKLTSLPELPSTLTHFFCSKNELTSLAVSELPNLQHLDCSNNRLKELTLNKSAPYDSIDVRNNYMIDTSTSIKGKTITWDTGKFTFTPQKTVPDTHTHAFTGEWKSDATGHWHECTCGEKDIIAAHTPGDWITDTPVTEIVDGTKHKECTVCGFITETGTIPATGAGSDDNGTSDSDKTGGSDSGNTNPSSPQTGDNSNVLLWVILALMSISGIAFTILTKSRRYKE